MALDSEAASGSGSDSVLGRPGPCEHHDFDDAGHPVRCNDSGEMVRVNGILVCLCPEHVAARQEKGVLVETRSEA